MVSFSFVLSASLERGEKAFFFFFFLYPWTELVQFWRLLQYRWCLACHWESPYYLDPSFLQQQQQQQQKPSRAWFPHLLLLSWLEINELLWPDSLHVWRREEWPDAWLNGGAVHVCVWVCSGVICSCSDRESIENGEVKLNLDNTSIIPSLPSGYPSF